MYFDASSLWLKTALFATINQEVKSMADESNPEKRPEGSKPSDPGAFTQQVQLNQVSARIPEKVGRGVFSNGVLVAQGPQEFVLDFTQRIAKPHQIVARVVLPPSCLPGLIGALTENLNRYQSVFGTVPSLVPPPPGTKPPSVAEIYDDLKFPDDMLAGVYANATMITHSQAEFCFDFIANLYPRSAVSCRVYLAAPHVPSLLNSLRQSFEQHQQKMAELQKKQSEHRKDK
jgi:Protein of unknown function (DUF3467)